MMLMFILPEKNSLYDTVINQSISGQEIAYAIKSYYKKYKACDDGMIFNEFLKHAASELMPVFV